MVLRALFLITLLLLGCNGRVFLNGQKEKKLHAFVEGKIQDSIDQVRQQREGSLVETKAEEGFINALVNNLPGAAQAFGKMREGLDTVLPHLAADSKNAKVEDCFGCQYVWMRVEQELGNSRVPSDVQSAFEKNCYDAMRTIILTKPCEIMFDAVNALVNDYLSGQYDSVDMCIRSKLCRM